MKMRTRMSIAAFAASTLAISAALPAEAAVTYKAAAAPAIGSLPAVDGSNNTIYSATESQSLDANGDTVYTESIVAVDATTLKKKTSYVYASWTDNGGPAGLFARDIRVNPKTHTVWVVATNATTTNSTVFEINGSTMKLIRTIADPQDYYVAGTLAVNPATNVAYVAYSWTLWYGGDASQVPLLTAINGSSGAITTQKLPAGTADETQIYPYGEPGNVAFDSANNGVYVSFNKHEYAYASGTLKLASSVAFPSTETAQSPLLTADGATHTIYAVGAKTLYSIAGSTNKISKSVAVTTGSPVIDPTIKTLYVGTRVIAETTLAATGTLPKPAVSVNGTTHTIYSAGYVVTRSGS